MLEILAIDDDTKILAVIKRSLEEEDFFCHITNSCEKGLELLKVFSIDLVLLDLDLDRNMNGFTLINALRKARIKVPIIVISGTAEVQEKIKALDMGADDYLVKPFDKGELISRVKRHILRSSNYYNNKFIVGEIEMNIETKTVIINKKGVEHFIKLTKKEYDLLALLMSKPGVTISKDTILKNLYRDKNEPDIKITDVLICKIRKALREYTSREYVHTFWSRGYSIKDFVSNNAAAKTNMVAAAEIDHNTIEGYGRNDRKKSQFQNFAESRKTNKPLKRNYQNTALPLSQRRMANADEDDFMMNEEDFAVNINKTKALIQRNPLKI